MTKFIRILLLFVLTIGLASCSDDDGPTTKNLTLNITGLENLGSDFVYEGWIIVSGSPVSTGRFTVNDNGDLSQTSFVLNIEMLAAASTFVLTIEPAAGDAPGPTDVHILGGDFTGNTSQLSISHGAALGNDFTSANGNYILATPTNGPDSDENSGVWFLDLSSGMPSVGLTLPTLPAGWKYEGWVVTGGQPVTSGKFLSATGVDEFDDFSGDLDGPPFPGEDYLVNAPAGLTFPTDLSGGKAVISIEPVPDNSPAPFLLKPLVGDIPADAADHFNYALGQNLNFPTGSANR